MFAYITLRDGQYYIDQLSAECEGITVSSNFRSRIGAHYGKNDNNVNGTKATAHIRFVTSGRVCHHNEALSCVNLSPVIRRVEWETAPHSINNVMWRFVWDGKFTVDPGQPNDGRTQTATLNVS